MYNFLDIKTAFTGLVGYKEENELTLDAALKQSSSGYYVNDLAGISLQNIKSGMFVKTDLSQDTVSTYLASIADAELLNLIQNFIKVKEKTLKTQKLVSNFDFIENYQTEKLLQTGGFHGFYFNFKNSKNLYGVLNSVSLQLDATDTVKIYLYDLQTKIPLKTFDYTVGQDLTQEYQDLTNWIVKYQDENGSGRTYLIGYYDYDSSNPLPDHQLSENTQSYRLDFDAKRCDYLNYMFISPVNVDKNYINYNSTTGVYDLPTVENIVNDSYSFGLNARISVDADYTDILVKYVDKFAQALQYQLALRIVNDFLYSNEFNHITESNRKLMQELAVSLENKLIGYSLYSPDGRELQRKGIYTEIVEELEGIDKVIFSKRRKMVL